MEAVIIYAFLNQHRKLFRMHKHYLTLQKHQLFTTMQTMSNPSFYVAYTHNKHHKYDLFLLLMKYLKDECIPRIVHMSLCCK